MFSIAAMTPRLLLLVCYCLIIVASQGGHSSSQHNIRGSGAEPDAVQRRTFNDNKNKNKDRPMPTKAQQTYAEHELMVLIHFNMGTYFNGGDPSCNRDNWVESGDAAAFNPYMLDTDQWGRVFQRLGAQHAVLTAKHGCGFLLWPSNVTIHPNSTTTDDETLPYNYAVGRPGISAIQFDVLDKFVTSMRKIDLGVGFYYSLKNNFYLNMKDHHFQYNSSMLLSGQIQMTKENYETMALGHLRELWTRYGALTEQWFDGGYPPSMQDRLHALLEELQPNMAVWRGQNITQSAIAWVGTESGSPTGDDIWSTGCKGLGPGDPDSPEWCPKGCDTTLQNSDRWFIVPEVTIRSLEVMIHLYHKTVGRNGVMELDVAVDKTGRVQYGHAQRYAQFGDYIRACYGSPLQQWKNQTGYLIDFEVPEPLGIDRIMLREDQWLGGQRVRHYIVYVQQQRQQQAAGSTIADDTEWTVFSEGHSIGNKRIDILGPNTTKPMLVTGLRVHVIAATGIPMFREIAVFAPCVDPNTFVSASAVL